MSKGYFAVIRQESDSGQFEVEFPGLDGCVTCGDTFAEAVENARDALDGWLEVSVEHGDVIPETVDPYATRAVRKGDRVVWVPAAPIKTKAVPVTISLREHLLEKIDRAAANDGMTRSTFITFHALQAAGQKDWAKKVRATGRRRSKV